MEAKPPLPVITREGGIPGSCLRGNNGKWEEPRLQPVCNTLLLVTSQDSMVMQVARGNVVINCGAGNGAGKNSMFYAMIRAGGHGRRPYNLVYGPYRLLRAVWLSAQGSLKSVANPMKSHISDSVFRHRAALKLRSHSYGYAPCVVPRIAPAQVARNM